MPPALGRQRQESTGLAGWLASGGPAGRACANRLRARGAVARDHRADQVLVHGGVYARTALLVRGVPVAIPAEQHAGLEVPGQRPGPTGTGLPGPGPCPRRGSAVRLPPVAVPAAPRAPASRRTAGRPT